MVFKILITLSYKNTRSHVLCSQKDRGVSLVGWLVVFMLHSGNFPSLHYILLAKPITMKYTLMT